MNVCAVHIDREEREPPRVMASEEERESSGGEIKPVSACLTQKFDVHRLEAQVRG